MKISRTQDFQPNYTHKFFFDSNVWLFLLYPQFNETTKSHIRKYSNFFDRILGKECLLVTNPIQISEMINVILSHELRLARRQGVATDLKSYRKTSEGKTSMGVAKTFTEQVLKFATLKSGIFGQQELKNLVTLCDTADFNDLFFGEFCKKEDCILVTHDYDFQEVPDLELELVSANWRYFS